MHRFHPFANPLVWRKSQWLVDSVEWSTVNVMGVVQEPFWSTGRFDISFTQRPPDYNLALKIASKQIVCSINQSIKIFNKQLSDCNRTYESHE